MMCVWKQACDVANAAGVQGAVSITPSNTAAVNICYGLSSLFGRTLGYERAMNVRMRLIWQKLQ